MNFFLNKPLAFFVGLILVFQSLLIPLTVLAQENSPLPSVEVDASAEPLVEPVPTDTSSPTPEESSTPEHSPADLPSPSPTPEPSDPHSPLIGPTESPTPAPSNIHQPSDSPNPSESPSPSSTPHPSENDQLDQILPDLPHIQEHPSDSPKPDLVVNNISVNTNHDRAVLGNNFMWGFEVANHGNATATFLGSGIHGIFEDFMPGDGVDVYSPPIIHTVRTTGIILCIQIDSHVYPKKERLRCAAIGLVTMPPNSWFNVGVEVHPTVVGHLKNPTGGQCMVDPNNLIVESSETNNTCSNTVKVFPEGTNLNPTVPVATPPAGDYLSDQLVSLSSVEDGGGVVSIYYTTDGSTPDQTKTHYTGPINVSHDMTIKAIGHDNFGNTSAVLTAVYGIAPVISGETSSSVSETSATITWTTDDLSTSRVVYDTVSHPVQGSAPNYDYVNSTIEDSSKVTSHSVLLSGLTAGTTYYYRTVSHGSPEAVSDEHSFTTSSPAVIASSSNNGGGGGGGDNGGSGGTSCNDSKPGSAPTLTGAVTGANSVTLNWNKAADPVTSYLITYGTSSGAQTYGNPNVGGKETTSYTVNNLSGGTTYFFRVRAGNGCNAGDFSNEVSATPGGVFVGGIASGFAPGVLGVSTEASPAASIEPQTSSQPEVLGTETQSNSVQTGFSGKIKLAIGLGILALLALLFFWLKKRKKSQNG